MSRTIPESVKGLTGGVIMFSALLASGCGANPAGDELPAASIGGESHKVPGSPFDGRRAFARLQTICNLGPRISATPEMKQQRVLLADHFRDRGAVVKLQDFQARHPADGATITMTNMIVHWHPQSKERILLCTHYDTRPLPDQDPHDPTGEFLGANDGASGVAVLMELAEHMPALETSFGVDFVFFDGEELVYNDRFDPYFLGSSHFARSYVNADDGVAYKYGVLLDMVGDAELQIYFEKNSFEKARPLTTDIWETARRLGVAEFIPRVRHEVLDDHLPLNDIARIPTCDIIDFDYPRPGVRIAYWHTRADIPTNCSAESLGKVGAVLLEWLKEAE